MRDHANIVREALGLFYSMAASGEKPSPRSEYVRDESRAALDALVAERDEAVEMSRQMVAAYELAGEETEAAEKERDEARRLLTLMRKRKGDFELPNYWKGEIDAALGEDA